MLLISLNKKKKIHLFILDKLTYRFTISNIKNAYLIK